jgi:hypothetical protein
VRQNRGCHDAQHGGGGQDPASASPHIATPKPTHGIAADDREQGINSENMAQPYTDAAEQCGSENHEGEQARGGCQANAALTQLETQEECSGERKQKKGQRCL